MPITYETAPASVLDLLAKVMRKHHPELARAEVRVAVLMALTDDASPAVVLRGYQCAATIQKLSIKQRVLTNHDALMILDGNRWLDWPERSQQALLDHELTHLEVGIDKDGFLKTDAIGRPKLYMRLHDWEIGGFEAVARRWGSDALDVVAARRFRREYGPTLFDDPAAPGSADRNARPSEAAAHAMQKLKDAGITDIRIGAGAGPDRPLRLTGGDA